MSNRSSCVPTRNVGLCYNESPAVQVLVIFAVMVLAAALADANLPLQSGRSRGDEHSQDDIGGPAMA